jgi:PAS domain S-box-containing protein
MVAAEGDADWRTSDMPGEKRGATRVVTVVSGVVDAATGRLDRVASVALVFIFIGLSALGLWIHGTTTGHAADAADHAVEGALYQQARFDLAVELADHREQGTEPRTSDSELRMAAVHLQRTLRDLGRSGTASDVAVVQTVLSLNRALLRLSSHYRVDLANGRGTAARRLDDSRIDPLFATMQQKLNHISASNQHQGLAELDQLLHEQDTVQNVIELGGGIGLLLAGLLVAALAGYRRRLEDEANALRESLASFRILFADNPLPMWVFDRVSLAFIEVNDAAVAKYGYSRQQFLSMTIADIRPKEDTDRLRADVDAHPVAPVAVSHGDGWRHTLADGAVIDVDVTTHSVSFADRPATLVVARDITMKKQASREIAEALARTEAAENQYRTLVEQLPAVVYRTEADGLDTTTYTSPVIKDLIGYSAEEVSGTLDAWLAFIHPDDRERVRADNAAGSVATDSIALEYRVIARDESVRWVRDEAVMVQDASGAPLYWQGLL